MICSMSMAMVCAQLSLFGPSAGATDAKSHSKCTVASSSAGLQVFRAQENCGHREGYTSLACRASSGGSRRDYEKILARQEKRRVREYSVPWCWNCLNVKTSCCDSSPQQS